MALGIVAVNAGRPPIIKVEVNNDRGFAFAEFWDVADCTACMQLDGIIYSGNPLRIRRPKDYIQPFGVSNAPNAWNAPVSPGRMHLCCVLLGHSINQTMGLNFIAVMNIEAHLI